MLLNQPRDDPLYGSPLFGRAYTKTTVKLWVQRYGDNR